MASGRRGRHVMVTAVLLVLANVLTLHMPLLEAQALDKYSNSGRVLELAHWTFDGTLASSETPTVPGTPEDPVAVTLPDGSCCYSFRGYTFCVNPVRPPPTSKCRTICGVNVCIFKSHGEVDDADGTEEFTPLDNCCFCYKPGRGIPIGIKVCLKPGGTSAICSRSVCGYKLCFSACFGDSQPGPAVPEGPNVHLVPRSGEEAGYIQIRQPGYLNLPAVHFNEYPAFAVSFSLRIPRYPDSIQTLYADWSAPHWQFISSLDPTGKLSVSLRRNMITDGSDPEQGLLDFDSGGTVVPVAAWFDVAFEFDKNTRTGNLFLFRKLVGSATVRASIPDADVVLMKSDSTYYQFGRKADTDNAGQLDADLRQLRILVAE